MTRIIKAKNILPGHVIAGREVIRVQQIGWAWVKVYVEGEKEPYEYAPDRDVVVETKRQDDAA